MVYRIHFISRRLFWSLLSAFLWVLAGNSQAENPSSEDHPALIQMLEKWQGNAAQSVEQTWQATEQQLNQQSQQIWLESPRLQLAHENKALSGDADNQLWEAGISFKLKPATQQEAQQQLASAYQTLPAGYRQFLKWQASGKLRALIADFQHNQAKAQAEQKNVAQLQKLTQQIQRAVELGARSQLDLVQAQAALQQQKILAQQAKTQQKTAKQALQYWLPEQNDSFEPEALRPAKNLSQHPQLVWLNSQHQLQAKQAQVAKTSTKDAVEWTLAVQHESMEGVDAQTLVAQASIPLSKDYSAQQDYLAMQNAQSKLQLERQQQQANIAAKITQAKAKLEELQAQQKSLQTSAQLQDKQLQLTQQAFDLGEIALQPLLLAQQSAQQTQQALKLLDVDMNAAIAQLNQAYGYLYQ